METINRFALTFLVNALWQIPLIALAVAAACRLMAGSPARYRHAVCVAGLVAAAILPLSGLWRHAPDRPVTTVTRQISAASGSTAAVPAPAPTPARSVPVPRTAANLGLWALGIFLLYRLARLCRATVHTIRICRTARVDDRAREVWKSCREAFGLRSARLRWSDAITGPVTAGRTIILPESMADAPDEILRTAIAHEAAHIARKDFAANLACELIALPISFHPATAWLRREIGRTRELACDELATERLVAPEVYARAIVSIAATVSGFVRPEYTLGVLDGDILEERVRRLLARRSANLKRAGLMLVAAGGALAVCVAIGAGLAISARAQSPAQQQLRAAAEAYNRRDFAEAARHFEQAVGTEPANLNARLFLANTYLRLERADLAEQQYREILRRDADNIVAIQGVVSLDGRDHPKESRELIQHAIAIDPKDARSYYTLAVLDWSVAYKALMATVGGGGPDMYRQIADPAVRARLRGEVGPAIEEGLRALHLCLGLDPDSSDAFAYMNLITRAKAPLVDEPAESTRLIAEADEWVQKALAARKAQPRKETRIDADGPPPAAMPVLLPAPPPPPPPPPPGK